MAKDLNKVQFTGRLGADPESKYSNSGNLIVTFSVASNRSHTDLEGNRVDATEWFRCVVFGKLAEICAQYLVKGARIYGEGRQQTSSWDDKDTGQKRFKTETILNDMIMLDSKGTGGGGHEDDDGFAEEDPAPSPAHQRATQSAPARQQQPQREPVRAAPPRTPALSRQQPGRRPPVQDDDDLPF